MLISIKILKRYCETTLNVFFKNFKLFKNLWKKFKKFKKKIFDDDKKIYLHDKFFESNQNFTSLVLVLVLIKYF